MSENAGGTQKLAEYTYLGWSTIVKIAHPQVSGGLNLSYGSAGSYGGFDRFGRVVGQEWRSDSGTLLDGYSYSYNRAGDRTSKGNLLNSAYSEAYSYDGLSRLTDTNRNGTNLQDWSLDALGNWSGFTDGATNQTRTSNAANEITGISGNWADPTYDAAGNTTTLPKAGDEATALTAIYDAWNRLVELRDGSNNLVARYEYDGRGFRVAKTVGSDRYDYYYNEGHQLLEVRKNGDADAVEQYTWDQRYIDAPVMVYRDTNTDGTVDQKLYVLQDANFNVTATVNGDTGAIVNRFVYTPYGQRTVLTSSWAAGATDFMLGHQGLLLDAESGMYYNRARMYHATLGRFIQRDPLGYVDGADLYLYEGARPIIWTDPSGNQPIPVAPPAPVPPYPIIPPGFGQPVPPGPVPTVPGGPGYVSPPPGGAVPMPPPNNPPGNPVIIPIFPVPIPGTCPKLPPKCPPRPVPPDGFEWWSPSIMTAPGELPQYPQPCLVPTRKARKTWEEDTRRCKPCIPPVGTMAYRVDTEHEHAGMKPHIKHMIVMQSPPSAGCRCFYKEVWTNWGTSPWPNEIPATGDSPGGGGIA